MTETFLADLFIYTLYVYLYIVAEANLPKKMHVLDMIT